MFTKGNTGKKPVVNKVAIHPKAGKSHKATPGVKDPHKK